MQLQDKVAIVTGGGGGIGGAVADRYAAEGASVVVADSNGEMAEAAAARLAATGAKATALAIDVGKPEDTTRMVAETTAAYGRVDILFNSAGVAKLTPFLETSLEEWSWIIAINLTGTFLCGQAAAKEMVRQGSGAIINVASIAGQRASTGRTAYGTSKGGVVMLTRQMAIELAEHGIRVNAIAPGPIETDMALRNLDATQQEAYMRHLPARRYGQPEEIADAALFLASDASSYVNGHTLNVDGGFKMAGMLI